jgi:serine/threonine protein kinase
MSVSHDEQRPARRRRPFRDVAIASGLVNEGDLDAAEAVARERLAAGGADRAADEGPRQFDATTAAVLVDQARLTSFQAREILAGRTRFRLGQYTVVDEIGRGGMGQVFKAEHALMGRTVAVKVLPRAKATPESEAAFRREMRILGRLDHENLVRAFDAGYDAMVYYLVTELVPGVDLRRQVRKYGPVDEVLACSIFTQVARALAFAHGQGLVHRDVKPGNILVMEDGRVKLLDLGLAGSTLEAEALRLGRIVGTMDYIAPEQIRSPDDVGPAADIYALGCSMYFALSGEVPFPGGTRKDKLRRHLVETPTPLQQIAPHLPQALCRVVEALMAKSIADRIDSADEAIRRLSRWTPDRPQPLPPRPQAVAAAEGDGAGEPGSETPGTGSAWPIAEDAAAADDASARRAAAGEFSQRFADALGTKGASVALLVAQQVVLPALIVGAGLAIVLSLVRGIDPTRFDGLLGVITPARCGWAAGFVIAAQRALPLVARRNR